jgi:outer membrane protein TolC
VTDSWRKVRVAANALEADLSIRLDGRIGTEPGTKNPVDFSGEGSRASVGIQFDGPLNRQAERNAYRASQIAYQRARRADMQINDQVELDVRVALRELNAQRLNFEINRQQLLAAVRSLDLERRTLTAPASERGNRGGNNAALRILQSQNQLLAARNRLTGLLFAYDQQRVRLLITLEALTLDDRGAPTDDPARFALPAARPQAP